MKEVFLEGKTIYLRGLKRKDLTLDYLQWFNDQKVCRFNSHAYFPNSAEKMEKYFNEIVCDSSNLVLAIIFRRDDSHIGNITLHSIDWISKSAEFAIIIGQKRYWGKGIGKEASDLILRHGFMMLNLNRIYCGTTRDNIPMQKLALGMGMKQEGIRRRALFKNGSYKDIIEYGILRDEYLKSSKLRG